MALAVSRALFSAGSSIEARIAMIAITTRSSIRVKRVLLMVPFSALLILLIKGEVSRISGQTGSYEDSFQNCISGPVQHRAGRPEARFPVPAGSRATDSPSKVRRST